MPWVYAFLEFRVLDFRQFDDFLAWVYELNETHN